MPGIVCGRAKLPETTMASPIMKKLAPGSRATEWQWIAKHGLCGGVEE